MTDRTPRVSVLMPAYNTEEYVAEAVNSILYQAFQDLELVVVDDGSTDQTLAILHSLRDPKLRVFSTANRGLEAACNTGLRHCRGELIARLDADDLSMPERLERQVRFLDDNPDVMMIGASCHRIDHQGRDIGDLTVPTDWESIVRFMFRDNPFVHSTVMFRRAAIEAVGPYDVTERHGDYELWIRMAAAFPVCNLAEPLIVRREHPENFSSTAMSETKARWERLRLQWKALRLLPWSMSAPYGLAVGALGWLGSAVGLKNAGQAAHAPS